MKVDNRDSAQTTIPYYLLMLTLPLKTKLPWKLSEFCLLVRERGMAWLVHCFSPEVYAKCIQLDTISPNDTLCNVFIKFTTWLFWALSSFSWHPWQPHVAFISRHFFLPLDTYLPHWQYFRKTKIANRKERQVIEWMGTEPILFSVCFPTHSFQSEVVCCWESRFFKMGFILKSILITLMRARAMFNCIFTGSFVRNLPGRIARRKNENSFFDVR